MTHDGKKTIRHKRSPGWCAQRGNADKVNFSKGLPLANPLFLLDRKLGETQIGREALLKQLPGKCSTCQDEIIFRFVHQEVFFLITPAPKSKPKATQKAKPNAERNVTCYDML